MRSQVTGHRSHKLIHLVFLSISILELTTLGCNQNSQGNSLVTSTTPDQANLKLQTGLSSAFSQYPTMLTNSISPYNCLPNGTCPAIAELDIPFFSPNIVGLTGSSPQSGLFGQQLNTYTGTYQGFPTTVDYSVTPSFSASAQPLSSPWNTWLKSTQLTLPSPLLVASPTIQISAVSGYTFVQDSSNPSNSNYISLNLAAPDPIIPATSNYEAAVIAQIIGNNTTALCQEITTTTLTPEANSAASWINNNSNLPFPSCTYQNSTAVTDPFNGMLGVATYNAKTSTFSYADGKLVLSSSQNCSTDGQGYINVNINYTLSDTTNSVQIFNMNAQANWNYYNNGCSWGCPSSSTSCSSVLPSAPVQEVSNITQPTIN